VLDKHVAGSASAAIYARESNDRASSASTCSHPHSS
jgi:hypothetical protein